MHGGNATVELGATNGKPLDPEQDGWLRKAGLKRICLIDYRSAGPGPRAVDAVALQASIRLADAAAITAEFAPGGGELKKDALREAIHRAASREQSEARWMKEAWAAPLDGEPVAGQQSALWARTSTLLAARMRQTFGDMPLEEYLAIAITLRDPAVRLRRRAAGPGPPARPALRSLQSGDRDRAAVGGSRASARWRPSTKSTTTSTAAPTPGTGGRTA